MCGCGSVYVCMYVYTTITHLPNGKVRLSLLVFHLVAVGQGECLCVCECVGRCAGTGGHRLGEAGGGKEHGRGGGGEEEGGLALAFGCVYVGVGVCVCGGDGSRCVLGRVVLLLLVLPFLFLAVVKVMVAVVCVCVCVTMYLSLLFFLHQILCDFYVCLATKGLMEQWDSFILDLDVDEEVCVCV